MKRDHNVVYGVFAHLNDGGITTGCGYVVRTAWSIPGYGYSYPYSTVKPIREYVTVGAAQRHADKLTHGMGRK